MMTQSFLPLLNPQVIEESRDLIIYALNGQKGQIIPRCMADKDMYLAVQQGVLKIHIHEQSYFLQTHECFFIPSEEIFSLEILDNLRARMVLPRNTELDFS